MDKKNTSRVNYSEVVKYKLPVYNPRSKDKLVTYYVLDPESLESGNPKMKRMRKKFCGIKDKKTRDFEAARFCAEITKKLTEGWNPLMVENENKTYTDFESIIKKYLTYLEKSKKEKTLKPQTFVSYENRVMILTDYIKNHNPIRYAYQFNTSFCTEYLDYIFYDRGVSSITRNSYQRWLNSFSNWMLQHGYVKSNPCSSIKSLRTSDKMRKCLSHEDLKLMKDYLEKNNPYYLLACQFCYYTYIRPTELTQIKICDISVEEQSVYVDHTISKNHRDAKVAIPLVLLRHIIELGVLDYPSDYFLFGHELKPGQKACTTTIIRNNWKRLRDALGWGKEYQFYSLKDTGITDSIEKNGLVVTRDQARHQNISTTNHYVLKEQLKPHEELKDYEGFL